MEVILLERVAKLGQMGEVVRVKDGYARNFLLPNNKALRATSANKAKFEGMKAELQAKSLAAKGDAGQIAANLDGQSYVVLRQASEVGQLYGSVTPRDLAGLMTQAGFKVERNQVALNAPIKTIGAHKVPVALHPEVEATVTVYVARSADEAERLKRGEDVTVRREAGVEEEDAEAVKVAAEAMFESKPADEEAAAQAEAKPAAPKDAKPAASKKA